jgi:membrane protease YdiL (CAAX protease family)
LYGILWFFILLIAVFIFVGIYLGMQTGFSQSDPKQSAQKIATILQNHSSLIALPAYILALIGSLLGFFPGTKIKQELPDVVTTDFDFLSAISLGIYALIIQFGAGIVLGSIVDFFNVPDLSNAPVMHCTLSGISSLGLAVFALYFSRKKIPSLYTFTACNPNVVFALVPTILGTCIISSEIDNMHRIWLSIPDTLTDLLLSMMRLGPLSILVVIIIGPVAEELVFRGIVLGFFLKKYSSKRAIVLSALIFAMIHMNPYQFLPAFGLGILLGWIYYMSKNIWLCMGVHLLCNAMSYATANNLLPFNIAGFSSPAQFQPLWFDMAGIALLLSGIWALAHIFYNSNPKDTQETT